jgi:hypothetical protein
VRSPARHCVGPAGAGAREPEAGGVDRAQMQGLGGAETGGEQAEGVADGRRGRRMGRGFDAGPGGLLGLWATLVIGSLGRRVEGVCMALGRRVEGVCMALGRRVEGVCMAGR